MLYDTSGLMKCQVKKYSGLNFARKIRSVAPDISSKIWYCGTSIGLTYDGLIASANFCRNRFCPTCQWRRSVKLFRQNYECFVALRKESVDRNDKTTSVSNGLKRSIPDVGLCFLRSPFAMFRLILLLLV